MFTNSDVVGLALQALNEASDKHAFGLHAYCFMPDHVHLLVSGDDASDLAAFVGLFKQLSG